MADQWKEYFYCEAMPANVLATKGHKKRHGPFQQLPRASREHHHQRNSMIAVADGQCMLIVEQGKVVEFCAEPGEFTLRSARTEPEHLLRQARRRHRRRFPQHRQAFHLRRRSARRISASTTSTRKELVGNKYGTASPRSVPRGRPARGDRHRHGHPLLRRVQLSDRRPTPVLHERLRQRERGLLTARTSTASSRPSC